MRGRPPKKKLTPEQERAASAFVNAAESTVAGSGLETALPSEAPDAPSVAPQAPASSRGPSDDSESLERPWEAPYVREDVVKGYALRLPEPLYLQLKWVAEQTGRSMNGVCREAIEEEVRRRLVESEQGARQGATRQ